MKVVAQTHLACEKLGSDFEAVKALKEAGFDGYDLSIFHRKSILYSPDPIGEAKKLRELSEKIGIPCLQSHAPFTCLRDAAHADEFRKTQLEPAVRVAGVVGSPVIVVHPGNNLSVETNYEHIYKPLLDVARPLGVKIATENMWNWDEENKRITSKNVACASIENFCRQVDIANDEYMTACLDLGHAEITDAPGAAAMIRGLGKRIGALHVHDVDKVNDLHVMPFEHDAKIDWDSVIAALREIGYKGAFTFEADNSFLRVPPELIVHALRYEAAIGRYFAGKIEAE